jgi:hypothetical protein
VQVGINQGAYAGAGLGATGSAGVCRPVCALAQAQ